MELGRLAISLPLPFLTSRECVALAQKAEDEWGYDAIWLAETAGPDAFALAGALAQATRRSSIGTAVVPVYTRTPAVLAMAASTLSQLSQGRFVLGIGSSSHAIVGEWNGVPFDRPLLRVRETVTVLRQALSGERTDFVGQTVKSRGLRLGSAPAPAVPIYLGALREKMLALAGELGDGLCVNLFPVSALPKMLEAYREGARRAGRDASRDEVVCRFQVAVTDDVPAARNLARLAFSAYIAAPVYNKFFAWCGFAQEAHAVAQAFARRDRAATGAAMSDALIDRVFILGSAAQCRAQIAEFVAAGVTTPVLSPLAADRRGISAVFEAFAPKKLGHRAAGKIPS
ncbi:MAG TPA: LLM class flavin-dependent oxidoreductase [Myxococcota bacterium]|nr:LLM class flavin-dependent oxidoreductase [Myxococcota bacterium]